MIPISDTSEREREKNTKKIRQKPNFCFVFLFAAAQWMYPPDWREQWKHGRKPFRSSSSAEDDVHWNLSALGFAFLLVDWSGGWASRVRDLSGIAFFFHHHLLLLRLLLGFVWMSASSVTGDEEEKNFRLLLPQRLPKYAHPVIGRRGPNYIRLRLIAPTAARCKRERERKKKREEGKKSTY